MDKRHKNRVRGKKGRGDYQHWLQEKEGFDVASLETLGEAFTPFSVLPTSPLMAQAYRKLCSLYWGGELKGRQKEVVSMLLDGLYNITEMSRRLNISKRTVKQALLSVRKKLL